MKTLIWIIVAIVILGGLFWFFSPNSDKQGQNQESNQENNGQISQISEDGKLESDDEVFNEIDNALAGLE